MEPLGFLPIMAIDYFSIYSKVGQFLLSPHMIAIFSVLIALGLSEAKNIWRHEKSRAAAFRVLAKELENQKQLLSYMKGLLSDGESYVHPSIDPFAINNFLSSEFIHLDADTELISKLHEHIQNISRLNHALFRIDLLATGWTSVHADQRKSLEDSLEKSMNSFIEDVDSCLSITGSSTN